MDFVLNWIRHNKFSTLLLLVVAFLIFRSSSVAFNLNQVNPMYDTFGSYSSYPETMDAKSMAPSMGRAEIASDIGFPPIFPPSNIPPTTATDRLIITDTFLSILVKDVAYSIGQVEGQLVKAGGFLIQSELTSPEGGAYGRISFRVPTNQRENMLEFLKGLGVKVVSEHSTGQDVTDQFADLDERLRILNTTKEKFTQIQDQAVRISDLLEIQRELVSIQSQIDSVIGQQKYLEQSADLSKISVDFSTDELALPYAPDDSWRPQLVFKQAIRSLITSVRSGVDTLIWIGVYSAIWLPLLLLFVAITKVASYWKNRQ